MYTEKYFAITKDYICYYSSKEKFVMLQRPLIKIPLKSIINYSLVKVTNNSKCADHLIIFVKISGEFMYLKKSCFENEYNKNEGYFIFKQEDNKTKNNFDCCSDEVEEDAVYKWFLILNYILHV